MTTLNHEKKNKYYTITLKNEGKKYFEKQRFLQRFTVCHLDKPELNYNNFCRFFLGGEATFGLPYNKSVNWFKLPVDSIRLPSRILAKVFIHHYLRYNLKKYSFLKNLHNFLSNKKELMMNTSVRLALK